MRVFDWRRQRAATLVPPTETQRAGTPVLNVPVSVWCVEGRGAAWLSRVVGCDDVRSCAAMMLSNPTTTTTGSHASSQHRHNNDEGVNDLP